MLGIGTFTRRYFEEFFSRVSSFRSPSLPKRGMGGVGGVENWPYPLKIYTLGRFEILKDDKKIEFSRKAQKKSLDLLKAVISYGAKDVPEEELSDALYPDSEDKIP